MDILALLDGVFERLERSGIAFCVYRNRQRIPSGLIAGGDVDICVSEGVSTATLLKILRDLKPIHIVERRSVVNFYLPMDNRFLQVDFKCRSSEWLGARHLGNDEMLRAIWIDSGIPVASVIHQAFLAWFDSVLWGGFFKQRYADLIYTAYRTDPSSLVDLLNRVFGEKLSHRLHLLLEDQRIEDSAVMAKRLRITMWLRAFVRQPGATAIGWGDHFWTEIQLRRRTRYPGCVVAILGPDGSGKSSVCEFVLDPKRAPLPFGTRRHLHLHRPVLPAPRDIRRGSVRRQPGPPPVNTDPHGKPTHGPMLSVMRMVYFLGDQWMSEFLWARHQLAKNCLHVHDRHMMELPVDPARYRFGGPGRLARLLAKLAPQPDITILLDAPTEVLQSRKREVPFEETDRQRQAYREFVAARRNGQVVDAAQPVDRVAEDVRQVILRYVAQRTRRRFDGPPRSRAWLK